MNQEWEGLLAGTEIEIYKEGKGQDFLRFLVFISCYVSHVRVINSYKLVTTIYLQYKYELSIHANSQLRRATQT